MIVIVTYPRPIGSIPPRAASRVAEERPREQEAWVSLPLTRRTGDAADAGTGAGGNMESDLGGVEIGGAGNPGAGLGGTRGTGFGSGA